MRIDKMISFDVDGNKFNFRVAGIFIDSQNKRFLTNTAEGIDFVVLPGGRVEMGESSVEALKREMIEELGLDITDLSLKAITENFFEFNNLKYHELQYVYIAKFVSSEIEQHSGRFYGKENKDIYQWINIDEIDSLNYKPAHLKQAIKEATTGDFSFRHLIHKGNG